MPEPVQPVPKERANRSWTAVVLAGGTSRRWAGRDKTAAPLAGRTVLERVATSVLPHTAALVVVAAADHPARAVVQDAALRAGCPLAWTREDPPCGGPLAGLAAGVAALVELVSRSGTPEIVSRSGTPEIVSRSGTPEIVIALAGDLPFAGTACLRLATALTDADPIDGGDIPEAALGVDPTGRAQPLLAAYRTAVLRRYFAALDPAGLPLRALLAELDVTEVPVTAVEAFDLDTPQDAETAERLLASTGR